MSASPPSVEPPPDPRQRLRGWLPHVLLLGLVAGTAGLVVVLLAPIHEPIFLAASLAALTAPALYEPWNRLLKRWLPRSGELLRRQVAGVLATCCIVALFLAPLLALILTTVGGISQAIDVVIGIATRDETRMGALFDAVERQFEGLTRWYPGLPFDAGQVRQWLSDLLTEASDLGPTFLGFLFRGTSSLLAHLALALIILPSCFAQGGLAARFVLGYTPLNDEQVQALATRHRSLVMRLLSDTVLFALSRGILLGALAWLFMNLPLVPMILIATFLSLVPAVGTTMVWLPLVIVLWTAGQVPTALAFAAIALGGSWALSYFRVKVGKRLDQASGIWLSFLLFLGLVGGLLSFGIKGFVIGPMVMILALLALTHLLPYYGMGHQEDLDALDDQRKA